MPYEVRIVEAMIRMGRREQALTLFNFLLKNQRSAGWNHWLTVQILGYLGDADDRSVRHMGRAVSTAIGRMPR